MADHTPLYNVFPCNLTVAPRGAAREGAKSEAAAAVELLLQGLEGAAVDVFFWWGM